MLPPIVVNAIAILAAVLMVVLVVRVAYNWFTSGNDEDAQTGSPVEVPVADLPERVSSTPPPPVAPVRAADLPADEPSVPVARKPVEPAEPVRPAAEDPVTADPDPVVVFEPAGRDEPTEEAAPGYAPTYITNPVPAGSASWTDRSLFKKADHANDNDLPQVQSDEVPTVTTDDYVFGPTLTPAFASLLPESEDRKAAVRKELVNAGYYEPHAWHNLAAIRYVGIALSIVFFGGLLLILPEQFELFAVAGLVLAPILAWSLPRLIVRGTATDRISDIERGMPDMLDMLNMCVSQGLTVQNSLARISREMYAAYPALAQELAIVVEQSKVGTLEQALHNFEDRVDVPEVHSFVALLTQTERMGTSVSYALADYSDGMRESLRQRADTKANQATFKLLFPTVLCLMPAVYLFLLGPALIELTDFIDNGGLEAVSEGSAQRFERPDP